MARLKITAEEYFEMISEAVTGAVQEAANEGSVTDDLVEQLEGIDRRLRLALKLPVDS